MSTSKYIEKQAYRSRYSPGRIGPASGDSPQEVAAPRDELPKFIPFLRRECGLEFFGRILEIGAGAAWLSAELSRLPKVVEVVATDFSPGSLKEDAPKVFQSHKANSAKITRTPADFHHLEFPDNYFDFVVCSEALHQAANMVQAIREVKRVLKPGGQFVAIREPVTPLMKLGSRAKRTGAEPGAADRPIYTLAHYRESFKQAALPLMIKRVNLSSGVKYYVNKVINGLTHARYAFIGRKQVTPARKERPDQAASSARWMLTRRTTARSHFGRSRGRRKRTVKKG